MLRIGYFGSRKSNGPAERIKESRKRHARRGRAFTKDNALDVSSRGCPVRIDNGRMFLYEPMNMFAWRPPRPSSSASAETTGLREHLP